MQPVGPYFRVSLFLFLHLSLFLLTTQLYFGQVPRISSFTFWTLHTPGIQSLLHDRNWGPVKRGLHLAVAACCLVNFVVVRATCSGSHWRVKFYCKASGVPGKEKSRHVSKSNYIRCSERRLIGNLFYRRNFLRKRSATCREKCRCAAPHTEKSDKPKQWTQYPYRFWKTQTTARISTWELSGNEQFIFLNIVYTN
jgi:hypothetical protein